MELSASNPASIGRLSVPAHAGIPSSSVSSHHRSSLPPTTSTVTGGDDDADDVERGLLSPNTWERSQLKAVTWRNYAVDVVIVIVIAVFAYLLHYDYLGGPNVRGYFQNDTTIYLPHKKNTVSNVSLQLFTFGLPAVVILLVSFFVDKAWSDRVRFRLFLWRPLLILIYITLVTTIITDAGKNIVGRLRPDFIDRCQPDYTIPGVVVDPISTYVAQPFVCTGKAKNILEGRRSFPSGHSSGSFAGATFLSLYLYQKLYPLSLPWLPTMIRPFLIFLAPTGAFAIAVSRSKDNRHHPLDIAIGSLIGILMGLCPLIFTSFAPDGGLSGWYDTRLPYPVKRRLPLVDGAVATDTAAAAAANAAATSPAIRVAGGVAGGVGEYSEYDYQPLMSALGLASPSSTSSTSRGGSSSSNRNHHTMGVNSSNGLQDRLAEEDAL